MLPDYVVDQDHRLKSSKRPKSEKVHRIIDIFLRILERSTLQVNAKNDAPNKKRRYELGSHSIYHYKCLLC